MLLGVSPQRHFLASYLYTDNTYFDYSYIPFGTELFNKTQAFDDQMFNMQMPNGMVIHESVVDSCEPGHCKITGPGWTGLRCRGRLHHQ